MDELIVQPVGGFVGMGGNANLKSEGRISMSALSPEDRAKVEAMFSHPQPPPGNFYYRITRQGPDGAKTVEVPVDAVPAALTASVTTVLK